MSSKSAKVLCAYKYLTIQDLVDISVTNIIVKNSVGILDRREAKVLDQCHEGIEQLWASKLISDRQYMALIKKLYNLLLREVTAFVDKNPKGVEAIF